eukprot:348886-Pelagomonas_calceolata.AAC.1
MGGLKGAWAERIQGHTWAAAFGRGAGGAKRPGAHERLRDWEGHLVKVGTGKGGRERAPPAARAQQSGRWGNRPGWL